MAENPASEPELEPSEQFYFEEVLRLTGREERLTRKPVLTSDQKAAFRALLPEIRQSSRKGLGPRTKRDLFNRLILSLGIKPILQETFDVVFSSADLNNEETVHSNVEQFRTLCMLEFGSFRASAYKHRSRCPQRCRDDGSWPAFFA